MRDPSVLAAYNRWVGVVIALVGTFVVAPSGTGLLLQSVSAAWRKLTSVARGRLARFLPFLRKSHTVHVTSAMSVGSVGNVTVTASGRVWRPDAPIDERLETLRQYITDVEGRVNVIGAQVREETAAQKQALEELERALKDELATLRLLLEAQAKEAAQIDARGLPVIGLGILLSGIPEELASIAFPFGWLFPLVGVLAATFALRHWWRMRRTTKAPAVA